MKLKQPIAVGAAAFALLLDSSIVVQMRPDPLAH
jgi:hypothetical protein